MMIFTRPRRENKDEGIKTREYFKFLQRLNQPELSNQEPRTYQLLMLFLAVEMENILSRSDQINKSHSGRIKGLVL